MTGSGSAHGWESPEGARCYARARELCLAVGDERERFPILWGFWIIHQARSELTERRKTVAELLAIAERHRDPAMLVEAHHASWGNPYLGDFASQLDHVERGLSHYDPAEHSRLAPQYGGHDAGVCGHCTGARLSGRPVIPNGRPRASPRRSGSPTGSRPR